MRKNISTGKKSYIIKILPYEQMVYAQPASVLENDTYKILLDFDIQTDHLISARRPDPIIMTKKKKKKKKKKQEKENLQNCRLYCLGWPQNKAERMWKER